MAKATGFSVKKRWYEILSVYCAACFEQYVFARREDQQEHRIKCKTCRQPVLAKDWTAIDKLFATRTKHATDQYHLKLRNERRQTNVTPTS